MRLLCCLALLTLVSACGGSGGSANQGAPAESEKPEISALSTSVTTDTENEQPAELNALHYMNAESFEAATQQSQPVNRLKQDLVVTGPIEDIVVDLGGLLYQVNQQDGVNYLEAWMSASGSLFDSTELVGLAQKADIQGVIAIPDSKEILSLGVTRPYECPEGAVCKPTPYAYVNDKINFSWMDVSDPAQPYLSASFEIDGQYLASQVVNDHLIVISHFVPSLLSSFEWDFSSDIERSALLLSASMEDLSAGIYEGSELQAFLNQGCYSEHEAEVYILGNMYNVTAISLSSKTISHNMCISAELAAINLDQNQFSITLKSGGTHQFFISETKADYISPN